MIDFNYYYYYYYLFNNTPGKNSLRQRKEPVAAENREHVARGMNLKKKLYIWQSKYTGSIGSKIPASKTWQGSLCTTLARYDKILYRNSFTKIYKFFLKSKPSSIGSKIPASETWQGSLFTTLARYDKILYKNSFTKI